MELDGEHSIGVPGGRARAVATAPLQRGYLVLSCFVVYVHLQSALCAKKEGSEQADNNGVTGAGRTIGAPGISRRRNT